MAALLLRARTEGRFAADLAAEAVSQRFGMAVEKEFPLDTDVLESLRRGFADMNAGRMLPGRSPDGF